MTLKDELWQRYQNEQRLQDYYNKKQAMQKQATQNTAASQSAAGVGANGGITGSRLADTAIDKGLDVASMFDPTGISQVLNTGFDIAQGVGNIINKQKSKNAQAAQQAASQSQSASLNDLYNRKAKMQNAAMNNLQRLNTNSGNYQTINDKLNAALSAVPQQSYGADAAQANQEAVNNAEAANNTQLQNNADMKSSVFDAVKNIGSSIAGAYTGGASGIGDTSLSDVPISDTAAVDTATVQSEPVRYTSEQTVPQVNTANTTQAGAPELPRGYADTSDITKADIIRYNLDKKLSQGKEGIKGALRDLYNGYQDNANNSFTKGDIYRQVMGGDTPADEQGTATGGAAGTQSPKSLMNRIGEAAGTGQRIMSNPWTQAAIAGIITRATDGDWADVANNAYQYGINKAASNYYNKLLNPDQAPAVLQNFTKDDYSAKALSEYRDMLGNAANLRANVQANKTNPTMKEYLDSLNAAGLLSADEYNTIIDNPNYNPDKRISLQAIKDRNTANYQGQQTANAADKNAISYVLGMLGIENDQKKIDIDQQKADTDKAYKEGMLGVNQQNANTNERYRDIMGNAAQQNADTNSFNAAARSAHYANQDTNAAADLQYKYSALNSVIADKNATREMKLEALQQKEFLRKIEAGEIVLMYNNETGEQEYVNKADVPLYKKHKWKISY